MGTQPHQEKTEHGKEPSALSVWLGRVIRVLVWFLVVLPLSSLRRVLDLLLGAIAFLLLLPMLACWALFLRFRQGAGQVFTAIPRHGRWAIPFPCVAFTRGPAVLRQAPAVGHVLRGELSLWGSRAHEAREEANGAGEFDYALHRQFTGRPGWIPLMGPPKPWPRGRGVRHAMGEALRAVPACLLGMGVPWAPAGLRAAGLPFHNATVHDVRLLARRAMEKNESPSQICLLNAATAFSQQPSAYYLEVLEEANLLLGHGAPFWWLGWLTARPVKPCPHPVQVLDALFDTAVQRGGSVFLLGSREEVLTPLRQWCESQYGAGAVAGVQPAGYAPQEEYAVLHRIRESGAALLLYAGEERREDMWIHQKLPETGAVLGMACGPLFEWIAGHPSHALEPAARRHAKEGPWQASPRSTLRILRKILLHALTPEAIRRDLEY